MNTIDTEFEQAKATVLRRFRARVEQFTPMPDGTSDVERERIKILSDAIHALENYTEEAKS